MNAPAYREFIYITKSGDPSTELVQILAQVMGSFHELNETDRRAALQWFITKYAPYIYGEK